MSSSPIILTLVPVHHPTDAQSISFLASDSMRLHLGGTHIKDSYSPRPSLHSVDFVFKESLLASNHAEISVRAGVVWITPLHEDDTVSINNQPLRSEETARIHHLDKLHLSYYESYDNAVNSVIELEVHLTSLPLPLLPSAGQALHYRLPHVSTTPTVFSAFQDLRASAARLENELSETRRRLQDALDAAEAHTCILTPPPRPYAQLLNDLKQECPPSDSPSAHACFPSPLASSISDSTSSPCTCSSLHICESSPSSSDRSSTGVASPVVAATSAPSSTPLSASPVTTSVLTSVLRSQTPPTQPMRAQYALTTPPPSSTSELPQSSSSFPSPSSMLSVPHSATELGMSCRDEDMDTAGAPTCGLTSVDIALQRIRSAWVKARTDLLHLPRGVRTAQLAASRVLRAWQTERAAVGCSTSSAAFVNRTSALSGGAGNAVPISVLSAPLPRTFGISPAAAPRSHIISDQPHPPPPSSSLCPPSSSAPAATLSPSPVIRSVTRRASSTSAAVRSGFSTSRSSSPSFRRITSRTATTASTPSPSRMCAPPHRRHPLSAQLRFYLDGSNGALTRLAPHRLFRHQPFSAPPSDLHHAVLPMHDILLVF
ncbi:hypothetical protein CF319_g9040 [Tilletia indica]|nr:hypothetical protein CF319_g9040 [Tilletia indica]